MRTCMSAWPWPSSAPDFRALAGLALACAAPGAACLLARARRALNRSYSCPLARTFSASTCRQHHQSYEAARHGQE